MERPTYKEVLKDVIRLSDEDKLELFRFLADVLLPKNQDSWPSA